MIDGKEINVLDNRISVDRIKSQSKQLVII